MSTIVRYNGVELTNVHTKQWDETVLYDDSGTDPIGIKYVLSFDAVVHQQTMPLQTAPVYSTDNSVYSNPVLMLSSLTRKLEQPRQELRITMGGLVKLLIRPASSSIVGEVHKQVDTNNGPRPTQCQVFHIAANRAFRIRWTVEASVLNCQHGKSGPDAAALSNRWSIREVMDEDFRIMRQISGSIHLAASGSKDNTIHPHAFRHLCFPGLEDGFRRQSIAFESNTAGNQLKYEITDVQSHYAAPWPAVRMSGRHSVSTADGHRFVTEMQIRLIGMPHASVKDLMARALQVCQFRINYQATKNGTVNGNRITNATITEELGDTPSVTVSMRIEETEAKPRLESIGTQIAKFGVLQLPALANAGTRQRNKESNDTKTYRPNKHPLATLYGYESWRGERNGLVLGLLRCVLQTQCEPVQSLHSIQQPAPSDNDYVRERLEETEVYQSPSSAAELSTSSPVGTWSDGHFDAMYITEAQSAKHIVERPLVRLPVAAASGNRQPTSTIVQLSTGLSAKVVTVDFERIGKPPELPAWSAHALADRLNFVPASVEFEILPPRLTATGDQLLYRVRAEYVYLADREMDLTQTIPLGRLPAISHRKTPSTVNLGQVFNSGTNS